MRRFQRSTTRSWRSISMVRISAEVEIQNIIRKGTLEGTVLPVLCGSAFKNKGIQPLLDAIVDYLPSPDDVSPYQCWTSEGEELSLNGTADEPMSALVFKIMTDPFVGHLSYIRVYSGEIKTGRYHHQYIAEQNRKGWQDNPAARK